MQIMTLLNKRVLVTGATGLIGKELAKPLLEKGFEVYAITIDDENPDNGIHWIKGNLFNADFIKKTMLDLKPNYLLNMAWCTTGDYLNSDMNYSFLQAGIQLLTEFSKNGGKRAVFVGTCFEYQFKDSPLKETDALQADRTTYSFCKNKLHEIADYYCTKNNISFAYGRIFYVYGHSEAKTRLTGMVIDKLSKNEQVVIKSGSLLKDYMYSKDIANAFVALMDSEVLGTVNICTGKAISIKEYVLEIAKQMEKESLVIFQDESSNQPPLIVGDNTRLIKEVRYKIIYDLKSGLKEIIGDL